MQKRLEDRSLHANESREWREGHGFRNGLFGVPEEEEEKSSIVDDLLNALDEQDREIMAEKAH